MGKMQNLSQTRTQSQRERGEERRQPECSASVDVEERREERSRRGRMLMIRACILTSNLPAAEMEVHPEGMRVGVGDA